MHPYTIDTGVRKKVIIYIFIFSIVLSSVLTYFLEAGILSTKAWLQQFVWIDQVLKICDTVGVTTNFIGVPFLYGVIYWIFDKYLWKQKIFKRFLNVPDLNGYWEGKLTSLTYQTTMDMKLEVKQQWSKINFYATFPESTSSSNVASIFIERDGKVTVGFGFINHSRELPQQYDEYNILEIDDDTHLFGRYFNNRDNSNIGHKGGNIGTFKLSKIN